MKIISERIDKEGKRRVTVVLENGEQLRAIREDSHYRLGYPVEDVVGSHIITEARQVTWCSASQAWVE